MESNFISEESPLSFTVSDIIRLRVPLDPIYNKIFYAIYSLFEKFEKFEKKKLINY